MLDNIVILDASCLIILAKIEQLDLLEKVYGSVITTEEVAQEFGEVLPNWITVKQIKDIQKQQILELHIDKGEASVIALALEKEKSLVVLDDYKARKTAEKLGVSYTGTLGIIIKAKKMGIIERVKPLLDMIRPTNFRLSKELEQEVLKKVDE